MKIGKRLLHNSAIRSLLCFLISLYMRLVYYTSTWEAINTDILDQQEKSGKGALFMFWHGRLFLMPHICKNASRMAVIISQHIDGELIARTVEYFGFSIIRGSTDRGSSQVIRQVIKTLRQSRHVGISPDGPRGPRMCINSNVVAIARMTGAPIIPITFSASKAHVFKSWDRFLLPKPFGKGVIICGNPTFISPHATEDDLKRAKLLLEDELNIMNHKADMLAAITPVLPENRDTPPKKRKVAI